MTALIKLNIETLHGKRHIINLNQLQLSCPRYLAEHITGIITGRNPGNSKVPDLVFYIDGKPLRAWLEQYRSLYNLSSPEVCVNLSERQRLDPGIESQGLRYSVDLAANHGIIHNVTWHPRQQGGFIVDIIKLVFSLFKFFLFIPKILIWFGSLIIWLIKAIIFLLVNLGEVLAKDGLLSFITYISQTLIMLPLRFIGSLFKSGVNKVGAVTLGAVWGADNVVNDEDDPSDPMDGPCDKRKCYAAEDGTVPFSVIVATILFPPLGVFMEYGLTSWLQLIICTLLTLMFYFPGLIYALIMLFC
jgi:uncharacterized membrane protein YqaE (UPF0057 family)